MSEKWPRARVGFLQGAALAMLIGVVAAIGGAADGQFAVVPLALGGMGLSVAGALLAVDRMYPGLMANERRRLVYAFVISAAVYLGLILLGASSEQDGVLALAGVPATVTGGLAIWMALRHRA